jgi:hypothetical protein
MCVQFIGMGTVTTALRGKNATQGQPRKLDYLHTKYVIQLRDLSADLIFEFFLAAILNRRVPYIDICISPFICIGKILWFYLKKKASVLF